METARHGAAKHVYKALHQRLESAHKDAQWNTFALQKFARTVPAPQKTLDNTSETSNYRLRALRLSEYVPSPSNLCEHDSSTRVRLNFSLFNLTTNCFFGNTCSSISAVLMQAKNYSCEANFNCDAYFHSKSMDNLCLVVAEVVLYVISKGSVVKELAGGWTAVSLPELAQHGVMKLPLRVGTPRKLLQVRNLTLDDRDVANGHLSLLLEPFHGLRCCALLLPDSAIVNYSDCIPGLARYSNDGHLTSSAHDITNTLARPKLCPVIDVFIDSLSVSFTEIPELHESNVQLLFSVHNGYHCISQPKTVTCCNQHLTNTYSCNSAVQIEALPVDPLVVILIEIELATSLHSTSSKNALKIGFTVIQPFYEISTGLRSRGGQLKIPLMSQACLWFEEHAIHCNSGTKDLKTYLGHMALYFSSTWSSNRDDEQLKAQEETNSLQDASLRKTSSSHHNFSEVQHRLSKVHAQRSLQTETLTSVSDTLKIRQLGAESIISIVVAQQAQQLGAMSKIHSTQLAQLAEAASDIQLEEVAQQQQQQLTCLASAMQSQLNRLAQTLGTSCQGTVEKDHGAFETAMHNRHTSSKESTENTSKREYWISSQEVCNKLADFTSSTSSRDTTYGVPNLVNEESNTTALDIHAYAKVNKVESKDNTHVRFPPYTQLPRGLCFDKADVRRLGGILIQFLGFQVNNSTHSPKSLNLKFTFQFFDFPPSNIEGTLGHLNNLKLSQENVAAENDINNFTTTANLVCKFNFDDTEYSSTDEDRMARLQQYLLLFPLVIDVWNSESHIQIGTLLVDQRDLLRQGKEFSESIHICPILNPNSTAVDSSTVSQTAITWNHPAQEDGILEPSCSTAEGFVVLKVFSAGHMKQNKHHSHQTENSNLQSADSKQVSPALESDGPIARQMKVAVSPVQMRAKMNTNTQLADANGDLSRLVTSLEERKTRRHHRLQQLRSGNTEINFGKSDTGYVVRQKITREVGLARERNKSDVIKEQIREKLCTRKVLEPAYGERCCFDFTFCNPFPMQQTFEIKISDAELKIVSGSAALGTEHEVDWNSSKVWDKLSPNNFLSLDAHETVSIPFMYQSFEIAQHCQNLTTNFTNTGEAKETSKKNSKQTSLQKRVEIFICLCSCNKLVAYFEVLIQPVSLVINQTVHLHAPESETLVRTVSLPTLQTSKNANIYRNNFAVRSSDPTVAVVPIAHQQYATLTSQIRCKCGAASQQKAFLIVFYKDESLSSVAGVLRVIIVVHQRVDLRAIVGQTRHTSVVVHTNKAMGMLNAYNTHPVELCVVPAKHFLDRSALELHLSFRPLFPGRQDILVHLTTDRGTRGIHTILVCSEARLPTISKSFLVKLSQHNTTLKKICYTNTYEVSQRFYFHSSIPQVLHFRPSTIKLAPKARGTVRLTFGPVDGWPVGLQFDREILVFVNDETDSTEEVFKIVCA
mmetsp:Transcript_22517/g.76559  ORF Transcript_22517/g.76559 Transcript_22517/m.76559 type:complete len:1438 (+) Transcript_22517:305-4618(+)